MSHADEGVLHAYLDGALAAAERREVETHLAGCEICRARLEEERALRARAADLLGFALPPEREAPPLESLARSARRRPRFLVPVAWAATLVLAVGLGWMLGGSAEKRLATGEGAPVPTGVAITAAPARAVAQPPAPAPGPRASADHPAVDRTGRDSAGPQTALALKSAPAAEPSAGAANAPPSAKAAGITSGSAVTADLAEKRQAPVAPAWGPVSADSARRILGADLVTIPGLPVRRIRASPLGDSTILIEQVLDSTTVLRLYERQPMPSTIMRMRAEDRSDAAAPRPSAQSPAAPDTAAPARDVGPVRVTLYAPGVTRDSLWRLALMLERTKR